MDNTICVLCKNFSSGSALCWSKAFFELHQYTKGDIFIHRCHLTDLWIIIVAMPPKAAIARTLALFFLSKLCLEPCCAKSCQDMEQLWGEVQGLVGSYAQCFREVIIHGYFLNFFFLSLG